jgi:hypothetical protein
VTILVKTSGIDYGLESQANEILRQGRKDITALSEKKDYFTEEQMKLRQDREVLNSNGVPDPHICSGLYKREFNPHAVAGARPSGILRDSWE